VIILREGGEYLQRRERRAWLCFVAASLAWIGLGVAGILLSYYALAVVPAAVVVAMRTAPQLKSIRKGRRGEHSVTELLQRLPDDYYLVNDIMVPGARGNIDHVVVGPCGVVVIETKRLAGKVFCKGDAWYVNGISRPSISGQVNRGATALRSFFKQHHPDLYTGFIESVTVFTHPLCRLSVNHPRAIVVRFSELLPLMIELGQSRRMPATTAARLADILTQSTSNTASEPSRVIEPTPRTGTAR
jgi:hypothetical protein